ncbi:MAG TPA: DNA ligase [Acidimicrobiia bacterium]|nr:DNA ligase [Acidimicrobiia bacterium]
MTPTYQPMLATPWPQAFDSDDWWFDLKWDGFRCLAYTDDRRVLLRSRNNKDLGRRYPDLLGLRTDVPAVIDGEIVAVGSDGKPSFFQLGFAPAQLVVFDLLYVGQDVTLLPLEGRWDLLARLDIEGPIIRVDSTRGAGVALFEAVREAGLEGIVAKKSGSRYLPGRRSGDWRKVVVRSQLRAVVGGYMRGEGGRAGSLGSLIVGLYRGNELLVAGAAGSGLDERSLRMLLPILKDSERRTSPFAERVDLPGEPVWVEPRLVAMIEYREWTPYRRLRAPVYKGLVHDVEPHDITWDSEAPHVEL